jgi:hypothetical protein
LTCRINFGGIGWSGSAFLPSPATVMESAMPHPALDPRFTRPTVASCPPFCFHRLRVLTGIGARVPRRTDAATLKETGEVPASGAAVERWVRHRMFLGWTSWRPTAMPLSHLCHATVAPLSCHCCATSKEFERYTTEC